jgi:hypothetical protein
MSIGVWRDRGLLSGSNGVSQRGAVRFGVGEKTFVRESAGSYSLLIVGAEYPYPPGGRRCFEPRERFVFSSVVDMTIVVVWVVKVFVDDDISVKS